MRFALAVLLAFHGIAHVPGFAGSWRLATFPDLPYHTRVLRGRLDVGHHGMRVLGTVWLLLALTFAAAATGALLDQGWWAGAAFVAAFVSLALCVLELPATHVGLPVNLLIIIALLAGRAFRWI